MKLKIGPVQICVSDLERARKWYGHVLGMKSVEEYPDFKCILMKLGQTEFDIGVPNSSWGEGWDKVKVGGRTAVFFETKDIEKACRELEEKGVRLTEKPYRRPWGEMKAVFADPDGNEFNLIEIINDV